MSFLPGRTPPYLCHSFPGRYIPPCLCNSWDIAYMFMSFIGGSTWSIHHSIAPEGCMNDEQNLLYLVCAPRIFFCWKHQWLSNLYQTILHTLTQWMLKLNISFIALFKSWMDKRMKFVLTYCLLFGGHCRKVHCGSDTCLADTTPVWHHPYRYDVNIKMASLWEQGLCPKQI